MSISDCVNINVELVNASLSVDYDEYSLKDCTQNNSLWTCNCSGNYDLILLTNLTTLNTYEFQINYTTKYLTESTRRRSSGGSWKPLNISNITNTTPYLNITNNTNNITYIITSNYTNQTILESPNTQNTTPVIYQPPTQTNPIVTTPPSQPPIGEVDGSKFPTLLVIIVSIIVIISIILFKVLGFNDKPKKPVITEPKPKYNPKWR